jgi:hypothetical protein
MGTRKIDFARCVWLALASDVTIADDDIVDAFRALNVVATQGRRRARGIIVELATFGDVVRCTRGGVDVGVEQRAALAVDICGKRYDIEKFNVGMENNDKHTKNNDDDDDDDDGRMQLCVKVPLSPALRKNIGRIIGVGGQNVRAVSTLTGCRCSIDNDKRRMTISATRLDADTPLNLELAQHLVLAFATKHAARSTSSSESSANRFCDDSSIEKFALANDVHVHFARHASLKDYARCLAIKQRGVTTTKHATTKPAATATSTSTRATRQATLPLLPGGRHKRLANVERQALRLRGSVDDADF